MSIIKLDSKTQSKAIAAGESLLSDEGKYLGFSFEVGSNRLLIYGSPVNIKERTDLLNELPLEELSKTPRLGTIFEITDITKPGFVLAWMFMNGLINYENLYGNSYSLYDNLIALNWLDYFGVSKDDGFYMTLQKPIQDLDVNTKLDTATKELLKEYYLKNPRRFFAFKMSLMLDVIPPGWTVEDLDRFVRDNAATVTRSVPGPGLSLLLGVPSESDSVRMLLSLPQPLTDFQKEWIQIFLKYRNLMSPSTVEKLQRKWAGLEPEEEKITTEMDRLRRMAAQQEEFDQWAQQPRGLLAIPATPGGLQALSSSTTQQPIELKRTEEGVTYAPWGVRAAIERNKNLAS